jgi:hypothetical protein
MSSEHCVLCPQCGCLSLGSLTVTGSGSSFCEDCLGDREIHETTRDEPSLTR